MARKFILVIGFLGFLTKAYAGQVQGVERSSGTARIKVMRGLQNYKPGGFVCVYEGRKVKTCGRILKVSRKIYTVLARFSKINLVRRGQRAQAAFLQHALDLSCGGLGRIVRVVPSRGFVIINRGTSCQHQTQSKVCFYSRGRQISCGYVQLAGKFRSRVQVRGKKAGLLRPGMGVQLVKGGGKSARKVKNGQGGVLEALEDHSDDLGGSFFSINKKVLKALKEDKQLIEEKPYYFGGYIKEDFAYAYDLPEPDFTKMRTTLNLGLDYEVSAHLKARLEVNYWYDYVYTYAENKEKPYPDSVVAGYEQDVDVPAAYMDWEVANAFFVKVGRQLVPWGVSDFEQITDLVNPREQREIGLVDSEDSRLAVFASKFTYLMPTFEATLALVHEPRPNRIAPEGSDFDALKKLREAVTIREELVEDVDFETTETFVRLLKTLPGGQIAFVYGYYYDDEASFRVYDILSDGEAAQVTLDLQHSPMETYGVYTNVAYGSILFKFEAALNQQKNVLRTDLQEQIAEDPSGNSLVVNDQVATVKTMLGFEYNGITDLTVIVEAVNTRNQDYTEESSGTQDQSIIYSVFSYDMLNGDLASNFAYTHLGEGRGRIFRVAFDYSLTDNLVFDLGAIMYEFSDSAGESELFNDKDRVFSGIKYSF